MSGFHTPVSGRGRLARNSIITIGSLYDSNKKIKANKSEEGPENGPLDEDQIVSDALSNLGERIKSKDVEQQGEKKAMEQLKVLETK